MYVPIPIVHYSIFSNQNLCSYRVLFNIPSPQIFTYYMFPVTMKKNNYNYSAFIASNEYTFLEIMFESLDISL